MTMNESKHDLKTQLAEYVAQQPASKQTFHKWMRILELASLAIPVAVFAVALYLSIAWRTVQTRAIPTAWFCFPLSFTPFLILVGLHAIVLRAFPPTALPLFASIVLPAFPRGVLPGKKQQLRVERQAVAWGWGLVVTALVAAAFWGLFVYAVWTLNLAMLEPLIRILAGVVGVGITVSILYSLYRSIFRSR